MRDAQSLRLTACALIVLLVTYCTPTSTCYMTRIPDLKNRDVLRYLHVRSARDLRMMFSRAPIYVDSVAGSQMGYREAILNNECIRSMLRRYNVPGDRVTVDVLGDSMLMMGTLFKPDSLVGRTLEQQAAYCFHYTYQEVDYNRNASIALNDCRTPDDVRDKAYDYCGVLVDRAHRRVVGFAMKLRGV
jgi:hypothetical protein